MAEYIERMKLLDALRAKGKSWLVYDEVNSIPAADVVPVRHGRWVFNDELDYMFHCTVCDNVAVRNTFKYCPHCGALMDKDGDGE